MQLFLPILTNETRMIDFMFGFKRIDDFVHFFANGLLIYTHATEDKNGFRYVMSTLIENELIRIKDLSEALGVPGKNIEKQLYIYQEIKLFEAEEQEMLAQRKQQPCKISVGEMLEIGRYNKLETLSPIYFQLNT